MVTCLKFLNNILAAEFQIKSKLSKSEARVSSVIFLKVGWRIFFCSAYPVRASLPACEHPDLYTFFPGNAFLLYICVLIGFNN